MANPVHGVSLPTSLEADLERCRSREPSRGPSVKQEVTLTNVRQEHTWDCGVAVVASVLTVARQRLASLRTVLPLLPCGAVESKSVWTIDLLYALHAGGMPHCALATTTDGVNPDHASLEFYQEVFDADEKRVSALMSRAEAAGIIVRKASLSADTIAAFLNAPRRMVIALVNSEALPRVCDRQPRFRQRQHSFAGHYILLYGMEERMFVYLDPGRAQHKHVIGADDFDHARRCPGTDEDLIFIYFDGEPGLPLREVLGPQLGGQSGRVCVEEDR